MKLTYFTNSLNEHFYEEMEGGKLLAAKIMSEEKIIYDKIKRRTMLKTAAAALVFGPFAASTPCRAPVPTNKANKDVVDLVSDVCIIGGGSGGIGAAIAATRAGANVILIDANDMLGGTSTLALVCNWEPGPGDSIADEIYQALSKTPNAVGIASDHNGDRSKGPFGLWLIDPNLKYEQTLRRSGLTRPQWRAMVFDPRTFHNTVMDILSQTGNCQTLLNTRFYAAESDGKQVHNITAVSDDGIVYHIQAHTFIDCTGGAKLCRVVGCDTMLGSESKNRFDEPSAPEKSLEILNGISLCYQIRKSNHPTRQAPPKTPVTGWIKSAHVHGSPEGSLIVNPLAMLPGIELINIGYEKSMAECKNRVKAHWHWLQSYETFSGYEFDSFAPMLGIRESYRVVGEYVLTQHDLLAGLEKQTHPDIIAIADHSMDIHGEGSRRVRGEIRAPYGIPFRCLIPKGWENLLIACRGASLSQIAASSCRLSRTIIWLGHAAGVAAALAAHANIPVVKVEISEVQKKVM